MSINIKNREAEALLQELKAATGKGTSEIVLELLREGVARQRRRSNRDERFRNIMEIAERYSSRLGPNPQSIDEIIGYDENGLPK